MRWHNQWLEAVFGFTLKILLSLIFWLCTFCGLTARSDVSSYEISVYWTHLEHERNSRDITSLELPNNTTMQITCTLFWKFPKNWMLYFRNGFDNLRLFAIRRILKSFWKILSFRRFRRFFQKQSQRDRKTDHISFDVSYHWKIHLCLRALIQVWMISWATMTNDHDRCIWSW